MGEIRPIAPVLMGADEKHLDTGSPAFLINSNHVRLFNMGGVNALPALDIG